jgi:hypothetical protein
MRRPNRPVSLSGLIVSFVLLSLSTSKAQIGVKIGAVAGEDFAGSQTLPSPFPNSTAQGATGYILGIAVDKNLIGPLSLETEILLTQRSFKDAATIPNGQPNAGNIQTWVEKINYLQLPVLFKLTPLDGKFQPYVFAGPNIGFKLSASSVTTQAGQSTTVDESTFSKYLDLGLDAGGGIGIQVIPLLTFFADARYTFGLVDVYNNVKGSTAGNLKARDIKWTGGLMFGF